MALTLRPGVSYCRPGDRAIFLDLARDRYFCLSIDAERAFAEWCAGRGSPDHAALTALIADDLLVDGSDAAPPLPCMPPPLPRASCWNDQTSASVRSVAMMAMRLTAARFAVATVPLARIIANYIRHKDRTKFDGACAVRVFETASALRRCATFVSPLNQCLPRSLATARRLVDVGVAPLLVLGVKLGPFEAHAWVQHGDVVVTDAIDHVRRFTPILVA